MLVVYIPGRMASMTITSINDTQEHPTLPGGQSNAVYKTKTKSDSSHERRHQKLAEKDERINL